MEELTAVFWSHISCLYVPALFVTDCRLAHLEAHERSNRARFELKYRNGE